MPSEINVMDAATTTSAVRITLPPRPTAPTIKRSDADRAKVAEIQEQIRIASEMPRTRKSVEWAYPSSANAKRFNRADIGCWVVECLTLGNPTSARAISAHDDRSDALTAAKAIPCEWMASFVAINPEDAAK